MSLMLVDGAGRPVISERHLRGAIIVALVLSLAYFMGGLVFRMGYMAAWLDVKQKLTDAELRARVKAAMGEKPAPAPETPNGAE